MNAGAYHKRFFTLSTFAASARELFAHLDDLHAAITQRHITHSFAEKILLAVTQVNGCRYCSYAHVRMALQAGVSELELRDLLHGEFSHMPERELVALLFAQHYAAQGDHYEAMAWQRLQEVYGIDAAAAILTHIRLITFANLYGNTFDVLLGRLTGHPVLGSRFFDEVVVLSAGATIVPVGLFIGLIMRRLNAIVCRHKSLKVHHD